MRVHGLDLMFDGLCHGPVALVTQRARFCCQNGKRRLGAVAELPGIGAGARNLARLGGEKTVEVLDNPEISRG
jgi:hypothetical protein